METFATPEEVRERIRTGSLYAAVVGLGYVGLPLAVHLANKGIVVMGVDKREEIVDSLRKGRSTIYEPGLEEELGKLLNKNLAFTKDISNAVGKSNVILVTVGTPFERRPILKDVLDVSREIAENLSEGKLVILRSTVPPGTTEKTVRRILQNDSSLKAGDDFGLAFVPERTVEGQALRELEELPEIVGGINKTSTIAASSFFKAIGHDVIEVSGPRVAEMAKLFDNVYRDVNIALANELALVCEQLGVDIIETIRACNTGPRTRVLTPGAGVGGSCLNKDPYVLVYMAKRRDLEARLIKSARERNEEMPQHMIELTKSAFKEMGKKVKGSNVTVLGLTFKRDTDDVRYSVAKPIIKQLERMGAHVIAYDPMVDSEKIKREFGDIKLAVDLKQAVSNSNAVIVLTDHPQFRFSISDLQESLKEPAAIVDGRHMLEPKEVIESGIIFRGVGRPVSFFKEGRL